MLLLLMIPSAVAEYNHDPFLDFIVTITIHHTNIILGLGNVCYVKDPAGCKVNANAAVLFNEKA